MNNPENENYEDAEFNELNENNDIRYKHFYRCKFSGCDFNGNDFSGTLFSDCIFKNSNLSLVRLDQTKIHNVIFKACKVIGVDFTQASKLILKLDFHDSRIVKCNFSSLNLPETEFINCQINQSDFFKSNLRRSKFNGADLESSVFDHTDLTEVDFTNATNYAINILNNNVKNAEFSMPEAIHLLDALEIKIQY